MKLFFHLNFLLFFLPYASFAEAYDYNLFNPVPKDKLRIMSTERSSKSDSIATIDPGHFQIETSLFNISQNKDCNSDYCKTVKIKNLGDTTTFRVGTTENSEIQIIFNSYQKRKIIEPTKITENKGFGDTNLRFKYSFAGNKGEKFGIALTPFIKLPTNQDNFGNHKIEGGLAMPLSLIINDQWSIGGMSQVNFLNDSNLSQNHRKSFYQSYLNAIYLTKNFTDKLYGFVEYSTYKIGSSDFAWQNSANFGLHYYLNNNFKIDVGFNIGLTEAADDFSYYSGLAYRF